jgi:hypothetical protein
MVDYTHRLLMEVSLLKKQLSGLLVDGTVKEVKGDKIRVVTGKDSEGKDILSPWIHTASMRGGARERRFFKEGQNVRLMNATGDLRQAVLLPGAPNKAFPSPDHANETGQDEETYQLGELRYRRKGDGYEMWLEEEKKSEGGSSGGSGSQTGSSASGQKGKQHSKIYLHKDHITHTIGEEDSEDKVVIKMTKDNIVQTIGKEVELKLTKDDIVKRVGEVVLSVTKQGVDIKKGYLKVNDIKVDETHIHKGVRPGTGTSGPPED